ncbi:hypothetical protein GCM10029978_045450 [Actinoallomurus acanthiterrae]
MARAVQQVKAGAEGRLAERIGIGVLTAAFAPDVVDAVADKWDAHERRVHTLPARVMAYFAMAMILHFDVGYGEVLAILWKCGHSDRHDLRDVREHAITSRPPRGGTSFQIANKHPTQRSNTLAFPRWSRTSPTTSTSAIQTLSMYWSAEINGGNSPSSR